MFKVMFAATLAIAMTVTASAHVWNRPAAPQSFGQPGFRISPCPVSYDFKRGFCVRAPASKKAWFSRAIGDIL